RRGWLDRAGGGASGPGAPAARPHGRRADSRGAGGGHALCPRDGLPTIDRRLERDQAALTSRTPPYGLESTKRSEQSVGTPPGCWRPGPGRAPPGFPSGTARSEEHTSELQSLAYLVCRLLLEKKKSTQRVELYEEGCGGPQDNR